MNKLYAGPNFNSMSPIINTYTEKPCSYLTTKAIIIRWGVHLLINCRIFVAVSRNPECLGHHVAGTVRHSAITVQNLVVMHEAPPLAFTEVDLTQPTLVPGEDVGAPGRAPPRRLTHQTLPLLLVGQADQFVSPEVLPEFIWLLLTQICRWGSNGVFRKSEIPSHM